ncbi:uncharacterized protein A1O9_07212 [Exophiala aquamarina CBS 119918]|uniref:DJ-1/PfpI domain-containing protein n=1 Tax=Exophiala aquamarina CBS 119918 TaxID=1182545 RepID=A0A072PB70_9EURO|nr:uncharacterized protein A1O9_07212 [Exophiala aquamarina CBS 119918]KEF57022.1 hypothetical protein A1O9_07212 [Exophiala aquamarina CBS 119918]
MTFNVLLPIFPGFNTLDVNGPLEVLKNSGLPDDTFEVWVASATELTQACEGVQIQRNISFQDILDPSSRIPIPVKLSDIDALIIPGARRWGIDDVLNSDDGGEGLLKLIREYGDYETETKPRWLISICTGSEFLGINGLLQGKPATTHWAAIPKLEALSEKYVKTHQEVEKIDVQRKRFIYSGRSKTGVNIATSGGISCGIDCVLWYVSIVMDLESAKKVAHFMDYPWGFADVDYTKGYEV